MQSNGIPCVKRGSCRRFIQRPAHAHPSLYNRLLNALPCRNLGFFSRSINALAGLTNLTLPIAVIFLISQYTIGILLFELL